MKDFVVARADLPRGARLWTFGTARHAADDGWTLEGGTLEAGKGSVELRFADAKATLVSPPDQVLRAAGLDTLYVGLRDADALTTIEVFARIEPSSPWTSIVPETKAAALARTAPGLAVPLAWPAEWRARDAIAESFKVVLKFRAGIEQARVDRIALYPRSNAAADARNRR